MSRRRNVNNKDSRRYYDWLDRAGEDLISSRELLKNDACYNNAAFHCQQTAEKALKAYILLNSGYIPDGHNLSWLCKKAMKFDKKFADWLYESATLNKCYIETRYPADIPLDMDYKKVKGHYETAKSMYKFICSEVDRILDKRKK